MRLSFLVACLTASLLAQPISDLGIFEGQSDVGNPALKGSGTFDPARKEYRVTGAGANIWAKADEFHFVWRRMSGDVSLSTTLRFAEAGGVGHRKIGLMIRQGLAPDAPYVDAMVHGDGLMALQYRETAGDITRSVRFPAVAPARIKLERRGPLFTLWTGREGQPLQEAGAIPMKLGDPVYVGLVVGSHNAKAIETAIFSDVSVESLKKELPLLGLDERWQFNLFDPDGTRVEFMQPRDPAKLVGQVPGLPDLAPAAPWQVGNLPHGDSR